MIHLPTSTSLHFIQTLVSDIYYKYTKIFNKFPLGFAHSNILKTPTTGSTTTGFTIRVPNPVTASSVNDDGILHPKAFQRAKTFLKTVLQNEVDALSEYGDKALLYNLVQTRYHRKDELVEAFKSQLLTFGRDQFPFKSGRNKDTDPLKWWKRLTQDKNADVLAVMYSQLCISYFADDSDRQLMSRFSQFYPTLCQMNVRYLSLHGKTLRSGATSLSVRWLTLSKWDNGIKFILQGYAPAAHTNQC